VPGLRLVTVADETIDKSSMPVEHFTWSADTEADALVRGDIGIAPTPSDRWTLGKCGFKIVQYMAAGLPVVASPVGANAELVRVGETGYLPEKPEEWAEHIIRLATDATLRAQMGRAAREWVERKYSLEHVADEWAKLLAN
jgi:glycosyltransferase involved in cell wall biosynthesis